MMRRKMAPVAVQPSIGEFHGTIGAFELRTVEEEATVSAGGRACRQR